MGMSTHVYGIVPPDDIWCKMKAVYDACVDANISVPADVESFFNGEATDPKGVVVCLNYPDHESVSEYVDDYRSGYEIDITKLPKNVKIVRVLNSW